MKIYLIFPGPLHPMIGMSQVRMLNQLKGLRGDHELFFSDVLSKADSSSVTAKALKELGIEYHPVWSPSYGKNRFVKALRVLALKSQLLFSATIKEELFLQSRHIRNQILSIAGSLKADAVLIHYWYLGFIFQQLGKDLLKLIDTHYLVEEHLELMNERKGPQSKHASNSNRKKLTHSLTMQRRYFLQSDLVIVNSAKQGRIINEWEPKIPVCVTVNGQELKPFLQYISEREPETAVLFYGSLGNQFNRKALKRILTGILPQIRKSIPSCKLYIVGANPPREIIEPFNDDSIITTGYVDDVKPHLSKCRAMLLPLETGSGFRGRTVELLALGIPIIGTHNGLQSVGFIDGELGYLAETDEDIAAKTIDLLLDRDLWKRLSDNCRTFAQKNFSLESTFGELSMQLTELGKNV